MLATPLQLFCRQLTQIEQKREGTLEHFEQYAQFMESLTEQELEENAWLEETHRARILHTLIAEYDMEHTKISYKDRRTAADHVLRYHDPLGVARQAIETLSKTDAQFAAYVGVWLHYAGPRSRRPAGEGRLLRQQSPDDDQAIRRYLEFLRQEYRIPRYMQWFLAANRSLKKLAPLPLEESAHTGDDMDVVEVPAYEHRIAPPPKPVIAIPPGLERLPPCLQRARLNMLRDNSRGATSQLWWQVFPDDEKALEDIPDEDRREWEREKRKDTLMMWPRPAGCETLAKQKRCPIAAHDIEDLPAGAQVAKHKVLQDMYHDRHARPQNLCARLCHIFTPSDRDANVWPGMFRKRK